ncbi:hypothetical protein HAX54_038519, partial [Datura stramonium]|nr:hypothetical protein [Datura stramonium]
MTRPCHAGTLVVHIGMASPKHGTTLITSMAWCGTGLSHSITRRVTGMSPIGVSWCLARCLPSVAWHQH